MNILVRWANRLTTDVTYKLVPVVMFAKVCLSTKATANLSLTTRQTFIIIVAAKKLNW